VENIPSGSVRFEFLGLVAITSREKIAEDGFGLTLTVPGTAVNDPCWFGCNVKYSPVLLLPV